MNKSQLLSDVAFDVERAKDTLNNEKVWFCSPPPADISKADGAFTALLFVKVNSEPGCSHFYCTA